MTSGPSVVDDRKQPGLAAVVGTAPAKTESQPTARLASRCWTWGALGPRVRRTSGPAREGSEGDGGTPSVLDGHPGEPSAEMIRHRYR
eukprot:scaffold1827_cov421-Prasinococcus_capsulatus_cf.AAC.21